MTDRLSRARTAGVLAVLRAPSPESALEAADAIIRGGIPGIEVTYTTPDAPAVIRELIARHGDDQLAGVDVVDAHLGPRILRLHQPTLDGIRAHGCQ
ncbi:MAG TPA: hypothetical protein VN041_09075, partial [Microbacterium sp.]|nr:hypothetical protein [Microbacterium sp.]